MAIVAIVLASNCSRIPENNDPVIYLGRYQKYNGSQLDFKTDFSWVTDKGVYTISYPGTDMINDVVSMKESPEGMLLEYIKGETLAKRE